MVWSFGTRIALSSQEVSTLGKRKVHLEHLLDDRKCSRETSHNGRKPEKEQHVRLCASLHFAPLFRRSGEAAFDVNAPRGVLSLPPIKKNAIYLNRLPLPPCDEDMKIKSLEDAAISQMKADLELSDGDIESLEVELIGRVSMSRGVRGRPLPTPYEAAVLTRVPLLRDGYRFTRAASAAVEELATSVDAIRLHEARLGTAIKAAAHMMTITDPRLFGLWQRYGATKLWRLAGSFASSLLAIAMVRWRCAHSVEQRAKKRAKYRRYQASHRFRWTWARWLRRCLARAWLRWLAYVEAIRHSEYARAGRLIVLGLQRRVRMVLARMRIESLRRERIANHQRFAAILLQTACRTQLTRRHYLQQRYVRRVEHAAIAVQCATRRKLAIFEVSRRVLECRRRAALLTAQRWWRLLLARRTVARLHRERAVHCVAHHVQRVWRGRRGRTMFATRMILKRRNDMVRRIQRPVKAYIAARTMIFEHQRSIDRQMLMIKHVLRAQAIFRGNRARAIQNLFSRSDALRKRKYVKATLFIQKSVRRFMAVLLLRKLQQERQYESIRAATVWSHMECQNHTISVNSASAEVAYERPASSANVERSPELPSGNIAKGFRADIYSSEQVQALSTRCSECENAKASRLCDQCGDQFCAPCFTATHSYHRRRDHTYTIISVAECAECDRHFATVYCRSCDEHFCQACFGQLHIGSRSRHQTIPYKAGQLAELALEAASRESSSEDPHL